MTEPQHGPARILGIATPDSEPAAAFAVEGRLAGAMEEAKVTRRLVRGELPWASIERCLEMARCAESEVELVAVARPLTSRLAPTLNLRLRERFPRARMLLVGHHLAHAASAFYASPFSEATVLTLDRGGDLRCGARWRGSGKHLHLESEFYYPDSLADLYTRITELLGFKPDADEHKTQWLSTGAADTLADLFERIICMEPEGVPRFDRTFFDPGRQTQGGFSSKFFEAIGGRPGAELDDATRALVAAGVQRGVERAVFHLAKGARNLCLAGGLAFNALLVSALERSRRFDGVFVQPAAGNAGTALGAVLHAWHGVLGRTERLDINGYFLGPEFGAEEIKRTLENCKLHFRYMLTRDELVSKAVELLQDQKIVAWMQGRMEFGPRALGNRSILASPLDPYSSENLNRFIKRREAFRKFAASVPAELAGEFFETGENANTLASVSRVRDAHRQTFRAALLGEDSIRVHTVDRDQNPLYWNLLHAAGKTTGLPVLYNTSFNLFGEPLVCSPRDGVRSFFASGIDAMFVGNFFLQK